MARARRSNDWGFPRWRGYEESREAATVRLGDRHGCEEKGDCPAPKSPNSPDRWYFCQRHAAEYNKGWDYFEGLDKEQAAERARTEQRDNAGYAEASHYSWGGSGDGSRSADEMRALDVLALGSIHIAVSILVHSGLVLLGAGLGAQLAAYRQSVPVRAGFALSLAGIALWLAFSTTR